MDHMNLIRLFSIFVITVHFVAGESQTVDCQDDSGEYGWKGGKNGNEHDPYPDESRSRNTLRSS
jgi:hypothetical protein